MICLVVAGVLLFIWWWPELHFIWSFPELSIFSNAYNIFSFVFVCISGCGQTKTSLACVLRLCFTLIKMFLYLIVKQPEAPFSVWLILHSCVSFIIQYRNYLIVLKPLLNARDYTPGNLMNLSIYI